MHPDGNSPVALPEGPFALVERCGNAMRLAAVCPEALALGLAPGLALADARARVPELGALPHDPAADLALLRRLARTAGDFAPVVALEPPDALLLDIAGSAHLFGGPQALVRRLSARLRPSHRHGFGLTPDAALAFARFPAAGGQWHRLPAAALGLPAE
ncbi:MAG: DNA polymerase Y family protein, partial [Sandaracinobacteroides sp.]